MLYRVSHAYGLKVGGLPYLVIPLVFVCGTVCHVVRWGLEGLLGVYKGGR